MKKKLPFIFGMLLIISLTLFCFITKKTNEKERTIKLGEVTHSIFYTPFYVSLENGYFKEKNINIDLRVISGANNVIAAVLSDDIDIGFCGPEALIYVYNGGEKNYVQAFAGLTKKDGQFLVSRKKINDFNFSNLIGKEVLAGRLAGMPELNFENALKKEGIDKSKVKINTSVDFSSLTSAFISGTGDFVNLFEPNATKLEKEGYGYVVDSIGNKSGNMPYTTFNSRKKFIKENKDLLKDFTYALFEGIKFTNENDAKTIAQVITKQFPDTSMNDLIAIIDRYKKADVWLETPFVEEKLFINLENIMLDSNQIDKKVNYNDIFNNLYKK